MEINETGYSGLRVVSKELSVLNLKKKKRKKNTVSDSKLYLSILLRNDTVENLNRIFVLASFTVRTCSISANDTVIRAQRAYYSTHYGEIMEIGDEIESFAGKRIEGKRKLLVIPDDKAIRGITIPLCWRDSANERREEGRIEIETRSRKKRSPGVFAGCCRLRSDVMPTKNGLPAGK